LLTVYSNNTRITNKKLTTLVGAIRFTISRLLIAIFWIRDGNEPSRAEHERLESLLVLVASCSARNLEQDPLLGSARARASSEFDARLGSRNSKLCSHLLGSARDARGLWLSSIQNVFTGFSMRFLYATC